MSRRSKSLALSVLASVGISVVLWIDKRRHSGHIPLFDPSHNSTSPHQNNHHGMKLIDTRRLYRPPDKGDAEECTTEEGYPKPCHPPPAFNNTNNSEGGYLDPSRWIEKPFDPRLPNLIQMKVYVGLKPQAQSLAHKLLAGILSRALNRSMTSIAIYMPSWYDDWENSYDFDQGELPNMPPPPMPSPGEEERSWRDKNDNDKDRGGGGSWRGGRRDGGGGGGGGWRGDRDGGEEGKRRRRDCRNGHCSGQGKNGNDHGRQVLGDLFTEDEDQIRFRLYLVPKRPKFMWDDGVRSWWRFKIRYNCFWGNSSMPVMNRPMRAALQEALTEMVQWYEEPVHDAMADMAGDQAMMISTDESVMSPGYDSPNWGESKDMDEVAGFEPAPPEGTMDTGRGVEPTTSFVEPLDSQEWDASRYIGLGLFLFVSLTGLILTQAGAIRRRQRIHKQVWSNLASEEGVKQLLNTGWTLKGDRMEVYDKSKVGYSDDDSMLIGGFEQKIALVGSEINIISGDSVDSPGTRSGPSSRNLYSSMDMNVPSRCLGGSDISPKSENHVDMNVPSRLLGDSEITPDFENQEDAAREPTNRLEI